MMNADTLVRDPKTLPARFLFRGQDGAAACGEAVPLPPGPAATLEARVGAALACAAPDAAIGGALPFDRAADDHLWQGRLDRAGLQPPAAPMPVLKATVRAQPSAADFASAVAGALRIMEAEAGRPDGLAKIVLARTLAVAADRPIPLDALLAALAQDSAVTAFHVALPPRDGRCRSLVGATPELLVRKDGDLVRSHPLAGSARRQADAAADRAAGQALLDSAKDRREHAIVVEYILDTLAPCCRALSCPQGVQLTATRSMWHLGTRIEGRLRDDTVPSVLLASRLHPTPAVCGQPRDRAAALIGRIEPVPRGFYAGAVGWCDARGDGAWHVAIRCAEICGSSARLFAGAGIVPGSDPLSEAAETGAKFAALLAALGLPADAALPTPR